MKKGIPPLVIGNWKMNPGSLALAKRLGSELSKRLAKTGAEVVIAPPHPFITILPESKAFSRGAQDVHPEKLGSHTGGISAPMLQSLGVTHVIIGHSERRAEGESDELVNQKLQRVVKEGLVGVVCVGETKRDHAGHYLSHIEQQVRKALAKITKTKLEHVVVAYEPVWAIGTGVNATSSDVHEMRLFIEKVLSDMYGRNDARRVRILYGGSVTGKNSGELFRDGTVNGFLVGGASLRPDEFVSIVKSTQS